MYCVDIVHVTLFGPYLRGFFYGFSFDERSFRISYAGVVVDFAAAFGVWNLFFFFSFFGIYVMSRLIFLRMME